MGLSPIFDKIINVTFSLYGAYTAGGVMFDNIVCPLVGRKPQVSISGTLYGNKTIAGIELKLTNYYPSQPLSNYKQVTITAGYKNSIFSSFTGEIWASYVSKPPPDRETTFMLNIGHFLDIVNANDDKFFNKTYSKEGSRLPTILYDIAALSPGLSIVYQGKLSFEGELLAMPLPCDFNFPNVSISEALQKIQEAYSDKLAIRPEGDYIYVIDKEIGTGRLFEIDYIISARDDTGQFTIVAPWNPMIRPFDRVQANPAYFTKRQGGMTIGTKILRVQTVDFSFDTCGNENQMTLICNPPEKSL